MADLEVELTIKMFRDGDIWCVMYRGDRENPIAGFGNTQEKAWLEFVKNIVIDGLIYMPMYEPIPKYRR